MAVHGRLWVVSGHHKTTIRRASSSLSNLVAERRPGSVLDIHQIENSRSKS
jgi:hypothetical protein